MKADSLNKCEFKFELERRIRPSRLYPTGPYKDTGTAPMSLGLGTVSFCT